MKKLIITLALLFSIGIKAQNDTIATYFIEDLKHKVLTFTQNPRLVGKKMDSLYSVNKFKYDSLYVRVKYKGQEFERLFYRKPKITKLQTIK